MEIYEDIRQKVQILQHLDLSNYPTQNPLFSIVNKDLSQIFITRINIELVIWDCNQYFKLEEIR